MQQDTYTALFSKLDASKTGDVSAQELHELVTQIEHRINHARILRLRMKAWAFLACMCIAVLAFIPVIQSASSSMSESGFSSYLSLIVSDGGSLINSWRQITFTLIESFPVLGTTALIALLLLFIYSLSRIMLYMKAIKTYQNIAI